jgi:nicotinic acid mononucleotide adenylyltransferase
MVDPWEAFHKEYQPTAVVLDHFDHEINVVRQGIDAGDGTRKPVRVALLAGADLIYTMSTPGVWSQKDLDHILGRYGVRVRQHQVICASIDMIPGIHRGTQRNRYRRGISNAAAVERQHSCHSAADPERRQQHENPFVSAT